MILARSLRRQLGGAVAPASAILVVLAAWQIGATLAATVWFPPLSAVLARLGDLFAEGQIQEALASSFFTLVVGFLLAVVIGVGIGIAMGLFRRVDLALRLYVDALLFVPPVVLAPIFFLFFGLSSWTLIAVVVTFSVFVIIQNTVTAIGVTDTEVMDMATSFGASFLEKLRDIILPGALPQIFAGLQLGMGRAVKGMIVGQIIISVVGLGYLERQFSNAFDAAGIWAVAITVISIAIVLTTVVKAIDGVVNWWAE